MLKMHAGRVAIVHELLTMRGGAERVARIFADIFPEAPVYTLLYDENKLGDWFPKDRVRTSYLQRFARYTVNHHLYLPFFPRAIEAWDFSAFDLVLSSSSAFAHGIITNSRPRHVCYVHSPARYLWDRTHDVQKSAGREFLGPLKKAYLSRTFHRLREWDAIAADRPDILIAPSREVQRRIELYWRRESKLLPPPIDDHWFAPNKENVEKKGTMLVVSTLAKYKRIELAIEACKQAKIPLIIVGEGPDQDRLKQFAGPKTTFLGYVEHEKLKQIYKEAAYTIVPGCEDFGLVPLESLSQGTPVIAFRGGGLIETLSEKTAIFFDEETTQSLGAALERSREWNADADACRAQAEQYRQGAFVRKLETLLERELAKEQ